MVMDTANVTSLLNGQKENYPCSSGQPYQHSLTWQLGTASNMVAAQVFNTDLLAEAICPKAMLWLTRTQNTTLDNENASASWDTYL